MDDTSENIDFDNEDHIQLLMNLREDIRSLLGAHPKGIWFRMLPKVFYMHFQRDIHLDMFAIPHSLLFLDYISDMIQFDLPDNPNEEDFIIELKTDGKQDAISSKGVVDVKVERKILLERLQKASLQDRGGLLRQICSIDERCKQIKMEEPIAPSPKVVVLTREQAVIRLQKIRSMIDFSLRYLLESSNEISDQDLSELHHNMQEFIDHQTPIAQRLSSSIS